jgi:BlaI family penicillinase repressor
MPRKTLGGLEQRVLEFLWNNPRSASETVRLSIGQDPPLTDSTIRTVLRRLEEKGYVRHAVEGRQYFYSPAGRPRRAAAEAVRDILKRFCRGSLEELLTGMVDHRIIRPAELRRLADKIASEEQKGRPS